MVNQDAVKKVRTLSDVRYFYYLTCGNINMLNRLDKNLFDKRWKQMITRHKRGLGSLTYPGVFNG